MPNPEQLDVWRGKPQKRHFRAQGFEVVRRRESNAFLHDGDERPRAGSALALRLLYRYIVLYRSQGNMILDIVLTIDWIGVGLYLDQTGSGGDRTQVVEA